MKLSKAIGYNHKLIQKNDNDFLKNISIYYFNF